MGIQLSLYDEGDVASRRGNLRDELRNRIPTLKSSVNWCGLGKLCSKSFSSAFASFQSVYSMDDEI